MSDTLFESAFWNSQGYGLVKKIKTSKFTKMNTAAAFVFVGAYPIFVALIINWIVRKIFGDYIRIPIR